jgi:excinuclease ABC subunit B
MFKLISTFKPTGDQPQAIEKLVAGINMGLKNQVLLGVTGSGKTFTIANVIERLQLPTLIISHNKTLAGQVYQEFRDFFPKNAVSYFVSYYDYYQPEAYIPATDTYIEKEAQINELIDKLRLQSTTNIMTRSDVIVVASVSCIYNIGSSAEYGKFILELFLNLKIDIKKIAKRLVELQYQRSEFEFKRGTFRVRENRIDIYPAYEDFGYSVILDSNKIIKIEKFEPISGKRITNNQAPITNLIIYPAKHYLTDPNIFKTVEQQIRNDLKIESDDLKKQGKSAEAERLIRKVNYDLEMLKEVGYVNGIENYSRYFDGRKKGDAPYTLINYFQEQYGDEWLLIIDESHMTIPQIRGMYNGDFSRKKTLVDFGFRLKAAFDNRPLKFDEFYPLGKKIIYLSATPDSWEMEKSKAKGIVEQLVRPTGIIDPEIFIRPAKMEIQDLILEIDKRVKKKERVLVTTLTKKTAEDLSAYLKEKNIKSAYLHSDIKTLERSDILDKLRKNDFDVLIGVNLLREGLDLPEVSLVVILDADREGFLRSRTSLIQTMGRAARNITGQVIFYADIMTKSINQAVSEINRRREYQSAYNKKHNITPKTIIKPFRDKIAEYDIKVGNNNDINDDFLNKLKDESLTPYDKKKLIKKLEKEMRQQAENLNFELAIKIREKVKELNSL